MAKKLGKSEVPGGNINDFQCFGPVAKVDGNFQGVMLADLGCFKQGEVDSNKYYHAAIVQSKTTSKWYVYFEWGRTGNSSKPQFQFVECNSKEEAQKEFESQLHSKNDKRGQWINVSGISVLEAKPGKDVYLVREQASRTTGLPDARNITSGDEIKKVVKKGKVKIDIEPEVGSLLKDLNIGTVAYTRATMVGDDMPTIRAINEGRDILKVAAQRIEKIGDSVEDQIQDKDLITLTNTLYSRIPKEKKRNLDASLWILNRRNIAIWNQDLDAFESALGAVEVEVEDNPYGDLPIELKWLGNSAKPLTPMAEWICNWMPSATLNKHNYLGRLRLKGIWEISRKDGRNLLPKVQDELLSQKLEIKERPLFQNGLRERPDLTTEEKKKYWHTNTSVLFHGSRSVNIRGILKSDLILRTNLNGVPMVGAAFGNGLYFADDYKKSVGYTSHPGAIYTGLNRGIIKNRIAFMFLGDVALGNSWVAKKTETTLSKAPDGYHSVFGKGNHTQGYHQKIQNNEFIVYNTKQNILKYLVEIDATKS